MTITVKDGSATKAITEFVTRHVQVATETFDDYARLTPIALRLLAEPRSKVAVIGLGFGILPRLLARHHRVTAFEIEPEMAEWFRRTYGWAEIEIVIGDFATTLRGQYDVIVYDLGGPVPGWLFARGLVIAP